MLVVGRKPGEYVMIDDTIKIKVVRTEDGCLRLAIQAPREMRILRGEIYEKEKRKKVRLSRAECFRTDYGIWTDGNPGAGSQI
ncbi:carbon storage regulator [Syntrophobotulus glycolicus DSM 8271]|uniref:Translational regulator CsrA n=1 Tax=Syntrophobotulus glycolicus (strain DSM 8271 / FlGlyR) TaxID=645991 RepID=F0SU36_SYNGF|nr:carbon storage regulator [Syntrophobotulus glycolicus]ADY55419.1 carbon storage regulator [Syntrophobotulus glycolicus DSM 8271]